MPGFNVHDPDLHILEDHFIEASAGTGKTYTIEQLVKRLIKEQGLKLEEILVVTFTRAATFELKQRIRAQLQKEGLDQQGKESIFTIHGFCAYALKDYAFETKFLLENTEATHSTHPIQQIVKDVLKAGLSFLHARQIELLFAMHRQDSESLVKHLTRLVTCRLSIEKGPSFAELDQIIQAKLATSSPGHLLEDLQNLAKVYGQMSDRQKQLKEPIQRSFAEIVEGKWLQSSLLLFRPDNRLKRGEDPILHHPELIQQLILTTQQALDPWAVLASVAECVRQRTEETLKEKEWICFEDLICLMQQAVHNPLYVQAVSQRYKAVLIDEFQDTDPRQWEIFSTLFLHRCPLYLIGDPKQAIYRFRQADIYTYLEAKQQLSNFSSLQSNYRSTKPLVEALNELFKDLVFPLPRLQSSLPYQPVLCGKQDEEALLPPLVLLQASDEEHLFQKVIKAIQAHPQLSVAVLVKDRYQAQRFAAICPLPLCLRRSRSILDPSTLECMEQLLAALLYPHDHHALQLLIQGRFQEYTAEHFWDWHIVLKQEGILNCFYKMFRVVGPCFVKQKGGEQLMHDLMHLAEILETRDQEDLLESFDELCQEDQEDEKFKGRQISEDQRIQVMTTHVSKGLEFDLVFPVGLALCATEKRDLVYCPDSQQLTYQEEAWLHYQEELKAEITRQLYVACTRAKKRLYIPVIDEENSPMSKLIQGKQLPVLEEAPIATKSPSSLSLHPPCQQVWQAKPIPIVSFTSLVEVEETDYSQGSNFLNETDILPSGLETGIILHAILEKISFHKPILPTDIAPYVVGTHLEKYSEHVVTMLQRVRQTPFPVEKPFTLSEVDPVKMQKEMPFLYPYQGGYCRGVLDLVFEYQGQYYLIDWKSNLIKGSLEQEFAQHQYALQGRLYHEALQRVLHALGHSAPIHTFFFFLRSHQNAMLRYSPEGKKC
ncbi:MAG: UvrD-helicase domain-containing protein [Verrucomicrobia bacterium]|nr:UvrD-helicase domain-containing protein [Verrucomicrobiota bacterium]MBS0646160.1 UvrD-helicase domain-containing protein [Verrucomicrobiota bacterium]